MPVDASWRTKARLYDVRELVATMSNAALSREGLALAVDHRRLKARGLTYSHGQSRMGFWDVSS